MCTLPTVPDVLCPTMILTDQQIREAHNAGNITIEPFADSQLQPATYDLRVGNQGATTSSKKIVNIRENGYLSIAPGDFGVVTVLEEVQLGTQYAARFGLRSKYARKGLIATAGPQIDPGYRGRLIIGVTNLTPRAISLPYKDDFISVEFHKLEEPARNPYSGPYQAKLELGPEEIEFITESEGMTLSEVLMTLRSLSQNVGALTTDVTLLTAQFKTFQWVVTVLVATGILLIAILSLLR